MYKTAWGEEGDVLDNLGPAIRPHDVRSHEKHRGAFCASETLQRGSNPITCSRRPAAPLNNKHPPPFHFFFPLTGQARR